MIAAAAVGVAAARAGTGAAVTAAGGADGVGAGTTAIAGGGGADGVDVSTVSAVACRGVPDAVAGTEAATGIDGTAVGTAATEAATGIDAAAVDTAGTGKSCTSSRGNAGSGSAAWASFGCTGPREFPSGSEAGVGGVEAAGAGFAGFFVAWTGAAPTVGLAAMRGSLVEGGTGDPVPAVDRAGTGAADCGIRGFPNAAAATGAFGTTGERDGTAGVDGTTVGGSAEVGGTAKMGGTVEVEETAKVGGTADLDAAGALDSVRGAVAASSISGSINSADASSVGTSDESGEANGCGSADTGKTPESAEGITGCSAGSSSIPGARSSSGSINPSLEGTGAEGSYVPDCGDLAPCNGTDASMRRGSSTGKSVRGSNTGRDAASIVFEPDSVSDQYPGRILQCRCGATCAMAHRSGGRPPVRDARHTRRMRLIADRHSK